MRLQEIIRRVLHRESLTHEELRHLADWMLSEDGREAFDRVVEDHLDDLPADHLLDYDAMLEQLHQRIEQKKHPKSMNLFRRTAVWVASAAAVLLIGVWSAIQWLRPAQVEQTELIAEVIPTHKAVLTLGNGSAVYLDLDNHEDLKENGSRIQIRDKQIDYTTDTLCQKEEYNVLRVQRGGEYKITLSDGTVVWMNSDSKLRYATQFVGKERRVFLEGEAYFEVAPDAKKPFLVETRNQTLQVLGTKFNISAYTNEIITTTLVQGCVNLTNSTTMLQQQLVPGEQAFIDSKSNKWQVKKVDVEDVIAWTKGMFVFNDQSLEQVMGKLERWYDVKVVYSDEAAKKIVFKGNLPRNLDLKTVLSMIERISSASFDMQENQVNVKVK